MKTKIITFLVVWSWPLFLFSGVTFAEEPPGEAEVFGGTDGEETAIDVGSVLGQATLRDSKCVVDAPITAVREYQTEALGRSSFGLSMKSVGLSFKKSDRVK